jgi:very-short-patch-repair endonuclease
MTDPDSPPPHRGWAGKPASPDLWRKLKPLARQMRHQPTHAERRLWAQLRAHRRLGFQFRRQHVVDRFILDFYCAVARLVIEVDGPSHGYSIEEDAIRQAYLESLGLRVMRFTNAQVMNHLASVLTAIDEVLSSIANAPK